MPLRQSTMLVSLNVERALRWASVCHHGQIRRGSGSPYVQHVFGVALVLDRLGFPEEVVIAGLLHDVVEDTNGTLEEIRDLFGEQVSTLVGHCSETKLDASGQKRPWIDRKRDHLLALADAPVEAKAIVLADKLHNLVSIAFDLREGLSVWSYFHAERDEVLWYYRTSIDSFSEGDPRLEALGSECRRLLAEVEKLNQFAA